MSEPIPVDTIDGPDGEPTDIVIDIDGTVTVAVIFGHLEIEADG